MFIVRTLRCGARHASLHSSAAGGDEPPCLRLGVGDQRLVVHLDQAIRAAGPRANGPSAAGIVGCRTQGRPAPMRIADVRVEIRGEDGKRIVDRIAPAMNQGGVGENAVDDPEPHEIAEHLVGDPLRAFGPNALQRRQIIVGEAPRRLGRRRDAPRVLARRVTGRPELQFPCLPRRQDGSTGSARSGWIPSGAIQRSASGVASLDPGIGLEVAFARRRRRDQSVDATDERVAV